MLIRLCGCAGWSAHLLFACYEVRLSHNEAQIKEVAQLVECQIPPEACCVLEQDSLSLMLSIVLIQEKVPTLLKNC